MTCRSGLATIGVVAALASAGHALAAQGRLAAATALRCTFSRQVTGGWTTDGSADATVDKVSLVLRFEAIDPDSGVAKSRSGTATSDITIKSSEGYLHLIQVFRTGAMYLTTVFDTGSAGRFKAVHSRHEYFTVPLPGATSRPEQYYGECEAQ